jgi:broad specificity phosphatase PhoE
MHLIFVRHGETAWNAERIYQGWSDVPLNALGERQAQAAARALAARTDLTVRALYASPLQRAWRTAEVVGAALGLTPQPLPGLRELHWGDASGLTSPKSPSSGRTWPNAGGRTGWASRRRAASLVGPCASASSPRSTRSSPATAIGRHRTKPW